MNISRSKNNSLPFVLASFGMTTQCLLKAAYEHARASSSTHLCAAASLAALKKYCIDATLLVLAIYSDYFEPLKCFS